MPHLHLMRFLPRQVTSFPALRHALQSMEAAALERLERAFTSRDDPDAASDLGERLGRLLGPRFFKHGHVVDNLRTAFPDWLPHRIQTTAVDIWGSVGRVVAEYPLLPRICDPAEGRIRVVDLGGLELVRREGRPGIFVSAHVANWNLAPVAPLRAGILGTVIFTEEKNPLLEAKFAAWRRAIGCGFLASGSAGRPMLRELREGRSLGLLTDQRYDKGEPVPFFGVPAPTTLAPARLALHLGLPLIPIRVQRLEKARFQVTVYPPIRPELDLPDHEVALGMTLKINRLFERWIREAPGQWLCVKRRWPRSRDRELWQDKQPLHGESPAIAGHGSDGRSEQR